VDPPEADPEVIHTEPDVVPTVVPVIIPTLPLAPDLPSVAMEATVKDPLDPNELAPATTEP
jgi:hypothetical protein